MIPDEVNNHFKCIEEEELLTYSGMLTAEMVTTIVNTLDRKLSDDRFSRGLKKNTIHILIECLQNTLKYAVLVKNERVIKLIIYLTNETLNIKIGNVILTSQVSTLINCIDELNHRNEDELREIYRNKLTASFVAPEESNGLGLIDIVRKSKNQLGYFLSRLTENWYFFSLHITIPQSV